MKFENIPFNIPTVFEKDFKKNFSKLRKNNKYSSVGYFSNKCEKWLKKNVNAKSALLTNSCTSALEMCALLLDLKKDDEIIMPSFTFVSTANAFVLRGAKPVFVDINNRDLNIDSNKIEKAITKKTKAIVVIHYAGISCDIKKIKSIAKKNKIFLIEDAAHSIFSYYEKKPLGSFGDLSTFSFHDTKNIHCGEGGALIINNKSLIEKSKIIRDKGTNRDKFLNNMVKKYTWVDIGSSYGLSEINACFLYSQLVHCERIIKERVRIFKKYYKIFSNYKNFQLPSICKKKKLNGHIFYVIVKNNRKLFMNYLKKNGIHTTFHYVPLHNSKAGKRYTKGNNLKNTEKLAKLVVRFPIFYNKKYFRENYFNKINSLISIYLKKYK